MSKTTKLDVAKEIVKEVGINITTQKATMVSDGLTKASKDALEALLSAILEMKEKHTAEMMAAVEDSKIGLKTKHITAN